MLFDGCAGCCRNLAVNWTLKAVQKFEKMQILGNSRDAAKLRKICTPLGIDVQPLVE